AFFIRAVLEVLDAVLDGVIRDDDAGVAGSAEGLHLGDGHRALVEVAAVLGRDVAPAAAAGLRVARVLGGQLELLVELGALVGVLLLADEAAEEQEREAVAVHVDAGLEAAAGVADQAAGLDAVEQPVAGAADVVAVLALADGAALAEERHPGQRR